MHFKLTLFVCFAALFISPAFGQSGGSNGSGGGGGGMLNISDLLNPILDTVTKMLNAVLGGEDDGVIQGLVTTLTELVKQLATAVTNLLGTLNLGEALGGVTGIIIDIVSGFFGTSDKLLEIVKLVVTKRTANTQLANDILTQYNVLINATAGYQSYLNAMSMNPVNGLLNSLRTDRPQLVKTLGDPVPMLCARQADTTADASTRAIATTFLANIRAAADAIKPGKCYGLPCISLIPAAQQISKQTNCA